MWFFLAVNDPEAFRQICLRVDVNQKNPVSLFGQSITKVKGNGCFSNAAFVIGDGNNLGIFHSNTS